MLGLGTQELMYDEEKKIYYFSADGDFGEAITRR